MSLFKFKSKKSKLIDVLTLKVAALEAELKSIKNSRPVRKIGKKVVMQNKTK